MDMIAIDTTDIQRRRGWAILSFCGERGFLSGSGRFWAETIPYTCCVVSANAWR